MKKTIALVVTLVLVGAFALSATMAYLTGETAPVSNVFVIGDIKIKLEELNWKPKEENEFKGKIIPGEEISKDPTVTVTQGSEACYLYMYLENNLAVTDDVVKTSTGWDYVTPNIDLNQWEIVPSASKLNTETGAKKELYRYKVGAGEQAGIIDAAKGPVRVSFFDKVKVPDANFTKQSMQAMATKSAGKTTITVQAFAYQAKNVSKDMATTAAIEWFNSIKS